MEFLQIHLRMREHTFGMFLPFEDEEGKMWKFIKSALSLIFVQISYSLLHTAQKRYFNRTSFVRLFCMEKYSG